MDRPLGQIIRPPTLVAAAAAKLRDAILSGDLSPGTPLPEVDVSESLNISRGSTREALRVLQDEGLVEIVPHKGASVTRLTPAKVEQISSLRAVLESYAVRIALENRAYGQQDLEQLERLVKRLGQLEKVGTVRESICTDMEFHRLICERSGHPLLLKVLESLRSLTMLLILNTKLYGSDMTDDESTHRAIFDAIRSGDPQLGEQVVREHVKQSGQWLFDRMREVDWESVNAS